MTKKMKNRILFTVFSAVLLLFAACESDRDSNPTLTVPESFELNIPAISQSVYNLDISDFVELSCTQPDYGYTAPAVYSVEVSMTEDFAVAEILPSVYSTAKMNVVSNEVAVAITNLKIAEGLIDTDFPLTTTVYIRLISNLSNTDAMVYSNPIALNVYLSFSLPPIVFPESMYLVGDHCGWSWDTATAMVPVYANGDGEFGGSFWYMEYFEAGNGMKVNTATAWNGNEKGFGAVTLEDNASAGLVDAGGNIGITNGGWYLVVVKTEIVGLDILYTISFNEPNVYLFGPTNGGNWEALPENIFTIPADGVSDFVSPAFVDAGEIRACVTIPGTDWWKSEFIVLGGVLEFRGNGPDQERATGAIGGKISVNFETRTGSIE